MLDKTTACQNRSETTEIPGKQSGVQYAATSSNSSILGFAKALHSAKYVDYLATDNRCRLE